MRVFRRDHAQGTARASRRRPRVLIIVENLPLARDVRVGKQVRSLVAGGYAVSVICRRAAGNRSFPGVDVYDYPAPHDARSKLGFVREYGYSWVMTAAATLRASLRTGFDVVQLCGPPDIFFPIALATKALGRPLVFDQRDPSPELYAARYGRAGGAMYQVLRLLERATYRSADHVITVNESLRRIACGRGGVSPDAVTVVGNGPVLAETGARAPQPELKRGREHLCCWIGAMGPQDRLDLGLRAIDHLVRVEGRKDCQFTFVGDGEALGDAMRLTVELGLTDWVRFTGHLSPHEVFTYLATADVGFDPSLDETVSPVKAMEYMVFGVPFVAFDLLEPRTTGGNAALYAPLGDVRAFAQLIGRLLDDADLRAQLGHAGQRRVTAQLAWDHQEPLYLTVFDRLVGADAQSQLRGERAVTRRTGRGPRPGPGTPVRGRAG